MNACGSRYCSRSLIASTKSPSFDRFKRTEHDDDGSFSVALDWQVRANALGRSNGIARIRSFPIFFAGALVVFAASFELAFALRYYSLFPSDIDIDESLYLIITLP
jgi:hypothetical protein